MKLLRKNYSIANDSNNKNVTQLNYIPASKLKSMTDKDSRMKHILSQSAYSKNETAETNVDLDKVYNVENDDEYEGEAESFISLHIASNLKDSTLHLSKNENNFYLEQIEEQFGNTNNKVKV